MALCCFHICDFMSFHILSSFVSSFSSLKLSGGERRRVCEKEEKEGERRERKVERVKMSSETFLTRARARFMSFIHQGM